MRQDKPFARPERADARQARPASRRDEPDIDEPGTDEPGIDDCDISDRKARPASRTPSAHRRSKPVPASKIPVGRTVSATCTGRRLSPHPPAATAPSTGPACAGSSTSRSTAHHHTPPSTSAGTHRRTMAASFGRTPGPVVRSIAGSGNPS